MEKRTCNIIMVCKGHHNFGEGLTLKQAVAHYMSKTCGCPVETYNDRILLSIVWEAFMDFMSTCTSPRGFLYQMKNARYWSDWSPREGVDEITAILIAFQLCRIRDKDGYVNGFSEKLINNYALEE